MSNHLKRKAYLIILPLLMLLAGPSLSAAADAGTITIEELKAQLGSPDIMILDVRTGTDWNSSEFKIQGARRAPSGDFEQWSAGYAKDTTLVLYCA